MIVTPQQELLEVRILAGLRRFVSAPGFLRTIVSYARSLVRLHALHLEH